VGETRRPGRAQLWAAPFNGDGFLSLAASLDGTKAFVAGFTLGTTKSYVTVADSS